MQCSAATPPDVWAWQDPCAWVDDTDIARAVRLYGIFVGRKVTVSWVWFLPIHLEGVEGVPLLHAGSAAPRV
jgi:hypothetical protein